jgi:uncharacterized protein
VLETHHLPLGDETLTCAFHPPHEHPTLPWPVILMGHGFSALWQFGTANFINAFNEAGFAVITFDYRHFGDSTGEPRQLLDIDKQIEDWHCVLDFLLTDGRVDPIRIGLWGSSLGGGHALSVAARRDEVKALVAQVPHCAASMVKQDATPRQMLMASAHIGLDKIKNALGMAPHYVAIVGEKGFSVLSFPGWATSYLRLVPAGANWINGVPARSLMASMKYDPIDVAIHILCPTLFIYGSRDPGVPRESVEATIDRVRNAESYCFNGDHFGVYEGPLHEDIVARQVEFFEKHLL